MKETQSGSLLHPFLLVSGEPFNRVALTLFEEETDENDISPDAPDDDTKCVHRIDAHHIIGRYQEQDEQ